MRGFTVQAESLQSAHRLCRALSEFHPELTGNDDEGFQVTVELEGSGRMILAVLAAIEDHVTERAKGPAHVELDGHRYTVHAR